VRRTRALGWCSQSTRKSGRISSTQQTIDHPHIRSPAPPWWGGVVMLTEASPRASPMASAETKATPWHENTSATVVSLEP
jgi:hypothetical protein